MSGTVASSQTIIENDKLKMEVIGLKRWTIPMIQDSLRRYAPKDSLMSHACAAVLREKLKFADASVTYLTIDMPGTTTKPYLAVTVVEPQDSALVRYRAAYRHARRARPEWRAVRTVFEKHNQAFQDAIQRPDFLLGSAPLPTADSALAPALPLRRFLAAHNTAKHEKLALATLASDGNSTNRVAAVVILAGFTESEPAWRALVTALRDPEAAVSSTAGQVLLGARQRAPRQVNWAPATESIRAILDGTNLFAHDGLMEVLAATRVDTALARPLLKDGGHLVLAKLGSQGISERQAARRFLTQVAGRDLGDDPEVWREWIRRL